MTNIIRTKTKGCYIQKQTQCGTAFVPVDDPLAIEPEPDVDSFTLAKDFPKLPENLVTAIYRLFYDLAKISKTEVSVLFLRNVEDPTIWKCLVPLQKVGPASVKADFSRTMDLFTAEEFSQFPPPGWFHAGSSHSHVDMNAFFSATDDESELKAPGLHIVWGKLTHQKVEILPSIVYRRNRYLIKDFSRVMEVDLINNSSTYNPKVKELVELAPRPAFTKFALPLGGSLMQAPPRVFKSNPKSLKGKSKSKKKNPQDDLQDPFFWQNDLVTLEQETDLDDVSDKELVEMLEDLLITLTWRANDGKPKLFDEYLSVLQDYV